jgi:hypothetical protein
VPHPLCSFKGAVFDASPAQTGRASQRLAVEQLVALRNGRTWFDSHRYFRRRRATAKITKQETSKTAPLKTKGCGTLSYFRASISITRNSSHLFRTRRHPSQQEKNNKEKKAHPLPKAQRVGHPRRVDHRRVRQSRRFARLATPKKEYALTRSAPRKTANARRWLRPETTNGRLGNWLLTNFDGALRRGG